MNRFQTLTLFFQKPPSPPSLLSQNLVRFGIWTMGILCSSADWIPYSSETPIPFIFPPIRTGKAQGIHSNLPVTRSLNIEGVRWIPLGARLLVPPRTYAQSFISFGWLNLSILDLGFMLGPYRKFRQVPF